jgi:hypothetical protein
MIQYNNLVKIGTLWAGFYWQTLEARPNTQSLTADLYLHSSRNFTYELSAGRIWTRQKNPARARRRAPEVMLAVSTTLSDSVAIRKCERRKNVDVKLMIELDLTGELDRSRIVAATGSCHDCG